ncbi:hypothetical protein COO60DRAFT_820747 [Scenedesmus sp. NREL 46B-D3]|nr:hypothetical protein COO60DRAFT_820747 [Scenedesmus sp. NREL 46B-D3]
MHHEFIIFFLFSLASAAAAAGIAVACLCRVQLMMHMIVLFNMCMFVLSNSILAYINASWWCNSCGLCWTSSCSTAL